MKGKTWQLHYSMYAVGDMGCTYVIGWALSILTVCYKIFVLPGLIIRSFNSFVCSEVRTKLKTGGTLYASTIKYCHRL